MEYQSFAVDVSPERCDRCDHNIEPQINGLSENMQRIWYILLYYTFLYVVLSEPIPAFISENIDELRTICRDPSAYTYWLQKPFRRISECLTKHFLINNWLTIQMRHTFCHVNELLELIRHYKTQGSHRSLHYNCPSI